MKFFIKELPTSCQTCNLNPKHKAPANYPEIECLKCNLMKKQDARHEDCPLCSLSDNYKQAQKEGAKKTAEYVNDLYKDFEPLDEFELNFILEKIDNGDL